MVVGEPGLIMQYVQPFSAHACRSRGPRYFPWSTVMFKSNYTSHIILSNLWEVLNATEVWYSVQKGYFVSVGLNLIECKHHLSCKMVVTNLLAPLWSWKWLLFQTESPPKTVYAMIIWAKWFHWILFVLAKRAGKQAEKTAVEAPGIAWTQPAMVSCAKA